MEIYVQKTVGAVRKRFGKEMERHNYFLPVDLNTAGEIFASSVLRHAAAVECDFTEEVEEEARIRMERSKKARRARRIGAGFLALGLAGVSVAGYRHFASKSHDSDATGQDTWEILRSAFEIILKTTKIAIPVAVANRDGKKMISFIAPPVPKNIAIVAKFDTSIRATSIHLETNPSLDGSITVEGEVYYIDSRLFTWLVKNKREFVRVFLLAKPMEGEAIYLSMQYEFNFSPEVRSLLDDYAQQAGKPGFFAEDIEHLLPSLLRNIPRLAPPDPEAPLPGE